ncbi:type VI secretion protein [Pseudomonas sp. C1C7]|uniref:type VI secretion system Vgr family protein n=1 Tax=Pseudomonas sp. C1C7 TaxID=2735272 RepID=UPI0015867335|nr:contractile injection system protein, VgrG/Pvc8 family [Pseudomonas sp. C1C7]NUT74007.1 type VI secretion protein [Pseudomonas sp. C1C7]
MFEPVNEPSFRLDVAGLSDTFEVLAFTGREALSEPFAFDVDLLIDDPSLDLASLLYRSASLRFGPQGNTVHGQLHELFQRDHGTTVRLCHVRLVPKLSCLAQRFSQRIFSGRSVPQILDRVLRQHGIVGDDRRFELSGDYPLLDFCTQYRESDLQFLQRLCARARIDYHFEHRAGGHCVVFSDRRGPFRVGDMTMFRPEGAQPAVRRFEVRHGAGNRYSQAECQTDLATLRSGQSMALAGHPVAEWNRQWLLTHVEHQGNQDLSIPYRNQVRAMQGMAPFAPPAKSPRPAMHSLQRAWVVSVDEPEPARSRPVAVQFDWLYEGEGATPSHCWLPLAPTLQSAGAATLREGTEVVVSFVDGDPDQPMITGILHQPAALEEAETPLETEQCPPEAVQEWLHSGEPLLMLCLMPGGGTFKQCEQAICTCRAAMGLARSGAA